MKIFAYDSESNKACSIHLPPALKETYLCTFGAATHSKKQVESWLEKKGYEIKSHGVENEFHSLRIGD